MDLSLEVMICNNCQAIAVGTPIRAWINLAMNGHSGSDIFAPVSTEEGSASAISFTAVDFCGEGCLVAYFNGPKTDRGPKNMKTLDLWERLHRSPGTLAEYEPPLGEFATDGAGSEATYEPKQSVFDSYKRDG